MALAYRDVSNLLVTMEALDPDDRERSGKLNILTVSFTQSISLVKKWIPSRRTVTVCVIRWAS